MFTSWDYGIANVETAHNKVASTIMGFREALLEESEKAKQKVKSWKVIGKRALANFLVLLLLLGREKIGKMRLILVTCCISPKMYPFTQKKPC